MQLQTARAASQDFTLHNDTGVEISEVYVAAHSSDNWEEDVLGKDTLADGASVDITFPPRDNTEMWDLKVTDSKGNAITWENLKLTELTDVTLHYKDGKAWADTKNGD